MHTAGTAVVFQKNNTVKLLKCMKRNDKSNLSPEQTIRRLLDYMPDFYRTHRQFINSTEFLDHREWELALDSLIELTVETEHYFSEHFWLGLADAADKMELSDKAVYCRKQVRRNEKEVKSKTPFAWTTVKIDDTHFKHHISEKLKEEWASARRKKDEVLELLRKDGVHLRSHGQSGYLYITDNEKILEVEVEFGMATFILYFDKATHWVLPSKQALKHEEKQKVKMLIDKWAIETKNAIEYGDQ